MYSLNCTHIDKWTSNVLDPAIEIISALLKEEKPKQKPMNDQIKNPKLTDNSNDDTYFCEVSTQIIVKI